MTALIGLMSANGAEEEIVDQKIFDHAVQIVCGTLREGIEAEFSAHDALIYCSRRGSKEVVPALIKHLEPIQKKTNKGKKKVSLECTWAHLLSALMIQTGQRFGYSQEKWQDWWDAEGKDLPEEYFMNQVNQYQANKSSYSTPESEASLRE